MGRDGMATKVCPLGVGSKREIPVGNLPPWVGIQKRKSLWGIYPHGEGKPPRGECEYRYGNPGVGRDGMATQGRVVMVWQLRDGS